MPVLLLKQMCKHGCICFCKANSGNSQGGIVLSPDIITCKAAAGLQAACCQFFADDLQCCYVVSSDSRCSFTNCSPSLRSHIAT